jgi:hypothetical protein
MAEDDFDDEYDADDDEDLADFEASSVITDNLEEVMEMGNKKRKLTSARNRIEDYMERRRLRDEMGDLDFDIDDFDIADFDID